MTIRGVEIVTMYLLPIIILEVEIIATILTVMGDPSTDKVNLTLHIVDVIILLILMIVIETHLIIDTIIIVNTIEIATEESIIESTFEIETIVLIILTTVVIVKEMIIPIIQSIIEMPPLVTDLHTIPTSTTHDIMIATTVMTNDVVVVIGVV
jgi:hypothetical protein